VRVLSNPGYRSVQAKPADVISRLAALCSGPNHEFWADPVNLTDESLIDPRHIGGHLHITDACLLALAFRRDGRLATFDRSIPLRAVMNAKPRHLEVIAGNATA
jgi:predicted nucleic acid-binding protein